MKALILVGGYGTRLRPLTFSKAKPLVPFCNLAICEHQIKALVEVGVKTIVLAVSYQPADMIAFLEQCQKQYGVEIICSEEKEPLGTAGPVALAKPWLTKDNEPFFMFNSDVICQFPLQQMLDFHKAHGKEGTIMVTPVEDPSKYGVVVSKPSGLIERFVEKPKEFISNRINAGIYLFNPAIIKRILPKPTSIEREIFPAMATDQTLYAMDLPGYWMDIGQPKDYLKGMVLHLNYLTESKQLAAPSAAQYPNVTFKGSVLLDPSCQIGAGSVIGPDVVVGPDVVIGAGARVKSTTLMQGTKVHSHAWVSQSIIGWESTIGAWAHVDGCVIGKDVQVGEETVLIGTTVCPHKGVKDNEYQPKIVM